MTSSNTLRRTDLPEQAVEGKKEIYGGSSDFTSGTKIVTHSTFTMTVTKVRLIGQKKTSKVQSPCKQSAEVTDTRP